MLALFTKIRSLPLIAVLTLSLSTGIAGATDWKGTEVSKDGALHVMNPAQSMIPAARRDAMEMWRAGGEDDEDVLFGVIGGITRDSDGNAYLLDLQLSEVHVFSPDGEFLRTIGREGEGPGEFRRPRGIMLYSDGSIGVMQSMPGRIVLITPDGEPAGIQAIPEGKDGANMFVSDGQLSGGNLVLMTGSFARKDTGVEITNSLMGIDKDGTVKATYWEETMKRNFANMVFDEKRDARPVWAVAADGRVLVNDNFDAYAVKVYDADGKLERVVEREYSHRKRSAKEMERNKPRIRMRRRNRNIDPKTTASETDRDVMQIFAREDDSVWVLSSRGTFDTPKGSIGTFDVFDKAGRYTRQVTVAGQFNPSEDRFYIVGNYIYVVTGAVNAERAMFGSGEESETQEEEEYVEPMQVICYDMSEIVRAMK